MCALKGRNLQYVASLLASIFIASSSMALLWTSTSIPLWLNSENSPLDEPISLEQYNTMYILQMLGTVMANICLGVLINSFGRRGTLLAMSLPLFISWAMIFFGGDINTILIARFLMGVALNVPTVVAVMYITEISEPERRGKLSILCLLFAEIGGIITFTVGPESYYDFALLAALIPVFAFVLFWFMPESPYFYLTKMRYQEAEVSLKWLRDAADVSEELQQITIAVEDNLKIKGNCRNILSNSRYNKAFFVVFGLKTIQEFSGGVFIQSEMVELLSTADTGLDTNTQHLVCILVPLPFMLAASFLIDKSGRKPLLYTSIIGTGFAMLIVSIYSFVQDSGSSTEGMQFLPVTGIFLYSSFKGLGINSIPVLIMNELFPTNIKGFASAIILVYDSILVTVLTLILFNLSLTYRLQGFFLFFAICCVFGLLFMIFCVPETKKKSLPEIHKEE